MAAGHHGPHCVIHNCNYVQVELLQRKQPYCKVGCAHQVVSGGVYQPKGGTGWQSKGAWEKAQGQA